MNTLRLSIAVLVVAGSFPQVSKKLDGSGGGGVPCPPGVVCGLDQSSQ